MVEVISIYNNDRIEMFKLSLDITQDAANNQSNIHYVLYSTSALTTGYYIVENLTIGTRLANNANVGANTVFQGNTSIKHNGDGSQLLYVYVHILVNGLEVGCTETKTIELPVIKPAAKIKSALNVVLGTNCNVTWASTDIAFSYKLIFSIGDWSETTDFIKPNNLEEYTYSGFRIPIDLANKMPNSRSGIMTVYLSTYSGITQVGATDSTTFTVTVPDSCKPNITQYSFEVDNSGNPTVNMWEQKICISGCSKMKFTASATGQYGATISRYKVSGGGYEAEPIADSGSMSHTSGVLLVSGVGESSQVEFAIKAIDSRGMESDSVTKRITVYHSGSLRIDSLSAKRSAEPDQGRKAIVTANWSYSSIAGNNNTTAELKYREATSRDWTTCDDTITNGQTITLKEEFSEDIAYYIQLTITDSIGNEVSRSVVLQTPFVLMDFRKGGKGLGIGGVTTRDMLEIMLDTSFVDCKVYIKNEMGEEVTLEDYIKQVVRSMQT